MMELSKMIFFLVITVSFLSGLVWGAFIVSVIALKIKAIKIIKEVKAE